MDAGFACSLPEARLVRRAEHLGPGRVLSADQRGFAGRRWNHRKPFHNLLAE